jgi:pimeloyl-ACP methyl ester carboxylesterase
MPYANNHGIHIYYEVEGKGNVPLILAHGGTGSDDDWRKSGYTAALSDECKLILLDARGHGKSDRPYEASISTMADDVISVMDAAGLSKTHYWGYSMGAAIGLDLAIHHATRFDSFIFGGISPYQWPEVMIRRIRDTIEAFQLRLTDPEAYLKSTEEYFKRPLTPEDRRQLLSQDVKTDIAILSALVKRKPLTNEELARITVPCLIYCGEEDPYYEGARDCIKHMPNARLASFPGMNHGNIIAESVLPHAKQFLFELTDK